MKILELGIAVLICGQLAVAFDVNSLWPRPAKYTCYKSKAVHDLSPNYQILTTATSVFMKDTIARYESILDLLTAGTESSSSIVTINITVANDHAALSVTANASYAIQFSNTTHVIDIAAPTQFGAQYALETVSQMFENGVLCKNFTIMDAPAQAYRALVVDVAHRFVPITTLERIIDGMGFSKLNVLHLHFADNGAVRIAAPAYPALAHGIDTYSLDDIVALVSYAAARSVVVVPDVSLPGPAQGFAAIADLCVDGSDLAATNATAAAVGGYLAAVLPAFGAPAYLFVGGSSFAEPAGSCNAAAFREVVANITANFTSWQLVAWAEGYATASLYFSTVANVNPSVYAGPPASYLLNSDATGAPFCGASDTQACFYSNTSAAVGVVTAVMTNNYCTVANCLAGPAPIGAAFAARSLDGVFSTALLALIFPHATLKGAAGWNYVNISAIDFARVADAVGARLAARSVGPCPAGCVCTDTTQCGTAYLAAPLGAVTTMEAGMIIAVTMFCALFSLIVFTLVRQNSRSRSDYHTINDRFSSEA